ncbi:MAG: hypothetical protein AAGH15_21965 [Myxococcota bacterium]
MRRTTLFWLTASAFLLSATSAFAQPPPESGGAAGGWGATTPSDPESGSSSGNPFTGPDAPEEPEAPPGQRGSGGESAAPAPAPAPPAEDDHVFAVGKIGLSFFGVDEVRLSPNPPPDAEGPGGFLFNLSEPLVVRAPVVGIRYWLSESIGIDAGIGIGVRSREDVNNLAFLDGGRGAAQFDGLDGVFALRVQAGVPISLKTYPHFNFLFIPEVGFSFGQATAIDADNPAQDIDFQNIGFDFNARVGGEIQFGFWGLPNLSLQATIGLGFAYQQLSATDSQAADSRLAVDVETTEWSLQTIANDIFNGTIRVLYYF